MGINDKLFRKPALCILAPSQYRNFKTFKIMENMYWGRAWNSNYFRFYMNHCIKSNYFILVE